MSSILDIENLILKLSKTKNNNITDMENYILLNLMKTFYGKDLLKLQIANINTNSIYLSENTKKGAIIKIKKPEQMIILDIKLTNNIRNFIKRTTVDKPKFYLFQDRNGFMYKSSAFSHKIRRLFKKHLGQSFSTRVLKNIYKNN